MTVTRPPGAQDPPATLSEAERAAAIDRVYDVALDPERFEALLDLWEAAVGPLRAQADFNAPRLLDDPQIAAHFSRAAAFLDRLDPAGARDGMQAILAPFGSVAAFVLDRGLTVCGVNAAATDHLGLRRGAPLAALPVHAADVEAVERTVRALLARAGDHIALLRVRARRGDRVIVLRLQRCATAGGTALVLVASNELGWPEGFDDILRDAFGLTGAEVAVVRALVECCSVTDIAAARGRSQGTIRAQIRSILGKTETHSQMELVRLALSMMDMARLTLDAAPGPRLVSRGYATLQERRFHTLTTPDGRRLDYLLLGDPAGAPLLYLPLDYGLVRWPASAEACATQRGIRVIVPVRAGYGRSDPLPARADYDAALLDDTLQVLAAQRVRRCPILSMAGDFCYAVLLARRAPGRFSAILACAGMLPLTRRAQFERMEKWHRFILAGAKYTPHLLPFMVKAGFVLARRIGKRGFIHAVYGNCPGDIETFETPEVFEAMVTGSETALSESRSAHDAFARQLLGVQLRDWSREVQALRGQLPVIFLNGTQDPQVPLATLDEFRRDFDWIDYHLFDDAGQLVFFRHWQAALDLIAPHLEEIPHHTPPGV